MALVNLCLSVSFIVRNFHEKWFRQNRCPADRKSTGRGDRVTSMSKIISGSQTGSESRMR
jgi:hypothetical protein